MERVLQDILGPRGHGNGASSVQDDVISQCGRPDIRVDLELITPPRAQALLDNMVHNRPLSQRQVDKLVEDMNNDNFHAINQGLGILDSGQTADGQHRLHAIIRSGKPQWMVVVRGIDADAMLAIDRGRARTMANYVHLLRHPHATVFSSAAKVIIKAQAAWDRPLKISSAQSLTISDFAEFDKIEELYERFDADIFASAARKMQKSPGIPNSVGAAFYCLATSLHAVDVVDKFIEDVRGCRPGKAAYLLGKRVEKELRPHRAKQLEYLNHLIYAFNRSYMTREAGIQENFTYHRPPKDGSLTEFYVPKV